MPIMVLVVILLIVVVAAVGVLTAAIKRHTPSDTRMDLNTYYGLEKEDDVALVLQNTVSDTKGKWMDGRVYLDYETVSNVLGGRFLLGSGQQPDALHHIKGDSSHSTGEHVLYGEW